MHCRIFCLFTSLLLLVGCIGASVNNLLPPANEITEGSVVLAQGIGVTFPNVTVSDLEGEEISLPGAFLGRRTLVVMAFKRVQQSNVDTWLRGTDEFAKSIPDMLVIEMPTIESSSAPFRSMVNNGMRSGIPSIETRKRVWTLFVNKAPLLKMLDITDESKIYAFLIGPDAKVTWRQEGDFDVSKFEELKAMLGAQ